MNWNQFRLWLLCYGFRAEHDLEWAQKAFEKWGCLLHYTAGISDIGCEELNAAFMNRCDDLTLCDIQSHPAIVDIDEVDEVMSKATLELDKLSEELEDSGEDILLELQQRELENESLKFSIHAKTRVELEQQRNRVLRELVDHVCRPCDGDSKCRYRLHLEHELEWVKTAIKARPTQVST